VLVLASSCAGRPDLPRPPADLLARPDKPAIAAEALTSERAFEAWRDDVDDWGTANAGTIDRACWWLADAGLKLDCRPRPAAQEK